MFKSLALLVLVSAAACSSSTTEAPPGTGATVADAAAPDDAASTAAAPKAPKIDTVAKMMGGLHVMWTNVEKSCTNIEVERQASLTTGAVKDAYKVVYTLPGVVDNKHDAAATQNMKYTYRLRCQKGGAYSDYSNEMSANPM